MWTQLALPEVEDFFVPGQLRIELETASARARLVIGSDPTGLFYVDLADGRVFADYPEYGSRYFVNSSLALFMKCIELLAGLGDQRPCFLDFRAIDEDIDGSVDGWWRLVEERLSLG